MRSSQLCVHGAGLPCVVHRGIPSLRSSCVFPIGTLTIRMHELIKGVPIQHAAKMNGAMLELPRRPQPWNVQAALDVNKNDAVKERRCSSAMNPKPAAHFPGLLWTVDPLAGGVRSGGQMPLQSSPPFSRLLWEPTTALVAYGALIHQWGISPQPSRIQKQTSATAPQSAHLLLLSATGARWGTMGRTRVNSTWRYTLAFPKHTVIPADLL